MRLFGAVRTSTSFWSRFLIQFEVKPFNFGYASKQKHPISAQKGKVKKREEMSKEFTKVFIGFDAFQTYQGLSAKQQEVYWKFFRKKHNAFILNFTNTKA